VTAAGLADAEVAIAAAEAALVDIVSRQFG
jgi:hypothetical protein